jgi:hypothetical protein
LAHSGPLRQAQLGANSCFCALFAGRRLARELLFRLPSTGGLIPMSTRSLSFAAPLALAAALFSNSSWAQSTCETSAECPMGYECQVTGGAACPGIACPDGAECPPPPDCQPQEFRDCVAVPHASTSDADCSDGMACLTQTFEECSVEPAMACAPDQECPMTEPAPPDCTSKTESYCVPRYVLPCQAAADCGPGFECKQEEICECSGSSSGSTPPSDGAGGAPEPTPEEPSCSCTPGDTSYCAIVEQVCATDAECPMDWTCSDNPEGVACSGPDGSSGTGADACRRTHTP